MSFSPLVSAFTSYYPGTETFTYGTGSGTFPTDLQQSNNVYRGLIEQNTAASDQSWTRTPNAQGTKNQWSIYASTCSAGSEWDCVNDDPNDGDGTALESATTNYESTFNFADVSFAGTPADVDICVHGWFRRTGSGGSSAKPMILSGASYAYATSFNPPNSVTYGASPDTCWDINPWTSADWTQAGINALEIGCAGSDANPSIRCTEIKIWIWANYSANYQLKVKHDFSGVTSGDTYTLAVEAYRNSVENMYVQVWAPGTPGTWNTRITITKTSDDNNDQTYVLTTTEYNSGSPSIQYIGATESSDTVQSTLFLDQVRVITSYNANYQLSVRHDWSGVPSGGSLYQLKIEAYRTNNGEDVLVQVATWPGPSWNTRITITKTSDDNNDQTYTLVTAELNTGAPAIRYLGGIESSDTAQDTVYIDHERIDFTSSNNPPTLTQNYIDPGSGTRATAFDFGAIYTDSDDNPPSWGPKVQIGTAVAVTVNQTLTGNNSGDTIYTDGKTYAFNFGTGYFCPASYNFFFSVSDGTAAIRTTPNQSFTVSNSAPSISNGGSAPTTVLHGRSYVFTFTATDADIPTCSQTLTWSKPVGPAWLTINPSTGVLSGTAPHNTGANSVTVRVSDGTAYDDYAYTVTVTNEDPTFISGVQASETVNIPIQYVHDYNAADASNDYLYFTFTSDNAELNIGAVNGTVWGYLTVAGTWTVTTTVHDDAIPNGTAQTSYTLTTEVYIPPTEEEEGGSQGLRHPVPQCNYNALTNGWSCVDKQNYYGMNVLWITWQVDGGQVIKTKPNAQVSLTNPDYALGWGTGTHSLTVKAYYLSGSVLPNSAPLWSNNTLNTALIVMLIIVVVLLACIANNRRLKR